MGIMKSRRANAVLFGFDFQRNAAIVLMLENIKDLRSVRLEGNEEDIELTLSPTLLIPSMMRIQAVLLVVYLLVDLFQICHQLHRK